MRIAVSTALLLAAGSVSRPGCGTKAPEPPPVPCMGAPAPVNPCGGMPCGAECTIRGGGCAPAAPDALGRCDAYEECIPLSEPSPACGPSSECAGKSCGTGCDRCGGACATPVPGACDYAGWCAAADVSWSCYDPCAGKACGASCTECPPGTPSCVENPVTKACDAGGHCVATSNPLGCPP